MQHARHSLFPIREGNGGGDTMINPVRTWQLISLLLAIALAATLMALHQHVTTGQRTTGKSPTVNSMSDATTFVLSPTTRRPHERYSL